LEARIQQGYRIKRENGFKEESNRGAGVNATRPVTSKTERKKDR